ncbi:S8 family serine peptidase [Nocardiopsis sp. NPDC058631]|uniref:S8 family serine peptidase n=1 Tax=Nocardiopsis sp. NPDC058631 TaxID=3346566 RepID=UPI0036665BE5
MTAHTDPGTARSRLRRTAAAALALGLLAPLPAAPAAAETPQDPASLTPVHPFKGEDQPCAATGGDLVEQTPWTHHFLGLSRAHDLSTGEGVGVALLAPEVDGGAPALADAVEGGQSTDCLGFGTSLAGVVAARSVEGSGLLGVAPDASVTAVATGSPRTGLVSVQEAAAGIGRAVDSGARVVLVGTGTWEASPALESAVADAEEADVLVVAPATVPTSRGPLPGHPAQNASVLSVAAHDVEGLPMAEGPLVLPSGDLARVDLIAPGDRVVGSGPGGGHVVTSGDGVAAAFVAGTAALLMAREPELSAEQVRERLSTTAYASPRGDADPLSGHGRVDPLAAMAIAPGGTPAGVVGEGFVPDPSPYGSVDAPPTAAVVSVTLLLIVLCVLGGVVIKRGRARKWRPAAHGEPVPFGEAVR